MLSPMPKI